MLIYLFIGIIISNQLDAIITTNLYKMFHHRLRGCGDVSFLWEKMEILTPCKIEIREQIDTQFVRIDYLNELNVCSKFGKNPFTGDFWSKG